jgi:hypothetical protein
MGSLSFLVCFLGGGWRATDAGRGDASAVRSRMIIWSTSPGFSCCRVLDETGWGVTGEAVEKQAEGAMRISAME